MDLLKLKRYLDKTWELLEKSEQEGYQVLRTNDPSLVKGLLDFNLPLSNETFDQLIIDFENEILPSLNRNTAPAFGAYITGSGNRVAAIAEFIKAFYNQNGLKWNNSPIASELEQLVIQWIAEFCLLSDHKRGVITSGGSMSNLLGIHFALADKYPNRENEGLANAPTFTIYCSSQTHSSVDRAMVFLGLGRNQLRKIGVNEQFEIDLNALRVEIERDISLGNTPLMIIGNAGTTNTGSIDDLSGLADIASQFGLWYHVDGAYGLPARRISELTSEFEGIDKADSVVINPHKWMYVPFEASCILLRKIPQAIHFSPDYLFTENPGERWESSTHTIELSKEFRALKIWFTMKYFGVNKLTEFVRKDIAMTNHLSVRLSLIPNVVVEPHHPLSILCFRYQDDRNTDEENELINIAAIRMIESQGKIFITGTRLNGKTFLRVYYGNPERTKKDVESMVKIVAETIDRAR
jgi:aromatic-L-amino-acid decarboxylase